ncbi:unnamed protein product [Lathyrus oleraceus]|uniref:Proteasome assembly chaperone 1 n=1 Tax=Pisum sativum TaxID=3888 RepID=A0A9D5BKU9_PEA|nr:uncharacterized protein LOC127134540 [Pisum sativum]KAI5445406.1 hypothetical protein KIW84_013590 [Pisum sativum]
MEDVITEAAPPSRLLEEDLNNFTPPSKPLPSPFLIFPHPQQQQPLKPNLLIIAISSTSLSLFQTILNYQTLTASLVLPELPLSDPDNTIDIHSISSNILLAAVRTSISDIRAYAVAEVLLNDRIRPDSVIILDSIQPMNHRGLLSSDEAVAFKLESSAERKKALEEKLLGGLEYYPSGSVVDGLGAAILGRCQILNLRASLCVSWPQFDSSVVLLLKDLLRQFDLGFNGDEALKFGRNRDHVFQSHLYI